MLEQTNVALFNYKYNTHYHIAKHYTFGIGTYKGISSQCSVCSGKFLRLSLLDNLSNVRLAL